MVDIENSILGGYERVCEPQRTQRISQRYAKEFFSAPSANPSAVSAVKLGFIRHE
jgi:hypothetical protein